MALVPFRDEAALLAEHSHDDHVTAVVRACAQRSFAPKSEMLVEAQGAKI
jgi:hypothetical protein